MHSHLGGSDIHRFQVAPNSPIVLPIVEAYYRDVDRASLLASPDAEIRAAAEISMQRLLGNFDVEAVYVRAGLVLKGIGEIEGFYRSPYPAGRLGFIGTHQLTEIAELAPNAVASRGIFTRSDDWKVRFADLWLGSPINSKIVYRETFLHDCDFVIEKDSPIPESAPEHRVTHLVSPELSISLGLSPRGLRHIDFVQSLDSARLSVSRYGAGGHRNLRPAA